MSSKTRNLSIDKILVDRFKSGDNTAFDEMVNRYWDRIFSRVLYLLKNRQDAEEVTQDAFMRAHRGLRDFRGDSSFSTWLFRIATNLAHNKYWYWWRRKRDVSLSLDESVGCDGNVVLEDFLPAEGDDPLQITVTNELVDRVSECLPSLCDKHREILALRIVHDLPYNEIAKQLSINVGTVKSRIARARQSLRRHIGNDFE